MEQARGTVPVRAQNSVFIRRWGLASAGGVPVLTGTSRSFLFHKLSKVGSGWQRMVRLHPNYGIHVLISDTHPSGKTKIGAQSPFYCLNFNHEGLTKYRLY